jgi:BirA family biotin operon repressor/biotin-[acetyl-CoA-carboxylase] ligase
MPHGVGAHFFESCDSTNSMATRYARRGDAGPVWIVAGSQTAGRGRKGRQWASTNGNLFTSLMFRPALSLPQLSALPYVVALGIRDAFVAVGCKTVNVKCKWPNDVLLNGKKAAGVLIESSAKGNGQLDHLTIGIGVNLEGSPSNAIFPATSCFEETGKLYTPREFLVALAATMKSRIDSWDVKNFSEIKSEWLANAWGMGSTRRVNTAADCFDAELVTLDDEGGLIVRLENGDKRTIVTADIFPAGTD